MSIERIKADEFLRRLAANRGDEITNEEPAAGGGSPTPEGDAKGGVGRSARELGNEGAERADDANDGYAGTGDGEGVCRVAWLFATSDERDDSLRALGIDGDVSDAVRYDFMRDYGFLFFRREVEGCDIAFVTQNRMGMAASASLVTRVIVALRPELVVMSGMCAGRAEKVGIGDVIAAGQTYDYSAGKAYVDRFAARPDPIRLSDDVRSVLNDCVAGSRSIGTEIVELWSSEGDYSKPHIYMKALASGTSVIDDGKTVEEASKLQDDLYGIDMEAYGFALGAEALRTEWVIIKGVQDLADGNKSEDEKSSRRYASLISAVTMKRFLVKYCEAKGWGETHEGE